MHFPGTLRTAFARITVALFSFFFKFILIDLFLKLYYNYFTVLFSVTDYAGFA